MNVCTSPICRCVFSVGDRPKRQGDRELAGALFECACPKRGRDGRCTRCRAKLGSVRERTARRRAKHKEQAHAR